MQLDKNAIIAREKPTQYLLILLPKDDKSKYLEKGGYNLNNWQKLEKDLREQILTLNAYPTKKTNYGQKYEIVGILNCLNGKQLEIKTIWIVRESLTQFVALFPA